MDALGEKHSVKSSLWTSGHFYDNEAQIANSQILISVGGPNYNPVTRDFLELVKLVKNNEEFSIGIGFQKALVYGNKEADSTRDAVHYFIENELSGFLEDVK